MVLFKACKSLSLCEIFDYSPFYGQRRPMLQHGAKLLCVSDLLLLGRATIEEARSLLHWLDSEAGFGKMGVCGLSMGMPHSSYLLIMKLLVLSFSSLTFPEHLSEQYKFILQY